MKQRYILAFISVALSIILTAVAFPAYNQYLKNMKQINEKNNHITELTDHINLLSAQFKTVKGDGAPKDLEGILSFLEEYEDVEIREVKSFNVRGEGVDIINEVTSTSDNQICDGYEINITSEELVKFIQYLGKGNFTYHSADFMFGAKKAILRIRTGGGV